MARSNILRAKNLTGSTLAAGKVVYISGFDTEDQVPYISLASCDDENKMPAVGVVREDIENGDTGVVKITGPVDAFDTSTVSINENVYVGQNGAVIYGDEPSTLNENWLTQQLGTVLKREEYPDGQVQLYPLEVKRRIKHPELLEVLEDQHHIKLHALTHSPNEIDEFIHARQHQRGGGDELSHGMLVDLDADGHLQYSLVNGTRDYTGIVSYNNSKTFTDPNQLISKEYADLHIKQDGSESFTGIVSYNFIPTFNNPEQIVTKRYVDAIIPGEVWRDPVIDKDLTTAPLFPNAGDRYIIAGTGGDWSPGSVDDIAEYDGSDWSFYTPTAGWATFVDDEDAIYAYNGVGWVIVSSGSGTPAGADTEIQYNDGGSFGANSGFTYIDTTGSINSSVTYAGDQWVSLINLSTDIASVSGFKSKIGTSFLSGEVFVTRSSWMVSGRSASNAFVIRDNPSDAVDEMWINCTGGPIYIAAGGTVNMVVDDDGHIGIGQFDGASGRPGVPTKQIDMFKLGTGCVVELASYSVDNAGSDYSRIVFRKSDTDGFGYSNTDSGDLIGELDFYGANGFSSAWTQGARLVAIQDGSVGTSQTPISFRFYTSDGTTLSERFRIRPGADVVVTSGIKVGSAASAEAGMIQWDGSNFQGHTGSGWVNLDGAGGSGSPGGSDGQIQYNNGGSFGGAAQLYYDDVNDRVGIGTSSPSGMLHLNGGDLYLALTSGQTPYHISGYASGTSLWLIPASGADGKVIISSNGAYDWDYQVALHYDSNTIGASGGIFTIGQLDKNNANYTHGITRFYTNGTERMRINASGQVGIGVDPSSRLHIKTLDGGSTPGNYFRIEGSTSDNTHYPGMEFKGGTFATGYPRIQVSNGGLAFQFISGSSSTYKQIIWDLSANSVGNGKADLTFDGTTRLRVEDTGELWLSEISSGATPDSGLGAFYVKTDGKAYFKNDGGTEYDLTASGGSPGGSDGQIQYNNGGAFGGSAQFYYDDVNDRVGIWTSAPWSRLGVVGNISASYYGTASSINPITCNRSRGTEGSPTVILDNDQILRLEGYGYDGSSWIKGAGVHAYADGAWGVGDNPTRLEFLVTPDASATAATVMTIDNAGLVGIGISAGSIQRELHVYKSQDGTTGIRAENPNTGTSAQANVQALSDSTQINLWAFGSNRDGNSLGIERAGAVGIFDANSTPATKMIIGTAGTSGNAAPIYFSTDGEPRMVIAADGNISISKNISVGGSIINKDLSETFQVILQALDGYTGADPGLEQTVHEHYVQHSEAIGHILESLDGYSSGAGTGTIDGEGKDGYLAVFSDEDTILGEPELFYDRNTDRLGVGTTEPNERLTVDGAISLAEQGEPNAEVGFGKLYVNINNGRIFFKMEDGQNIDLTAFDIDGGSFTDTFESTTNFDAGEW